MGCFDFFKEKARIRYRRKSKASSASVSMATMVSSSVLNNGTTTSVSDGSSAAKQMSKSSASMSSPSSLPALYEERAHQLRVFDLRDLRNATNDFSRLLRIGEGGFGSVYKGFIKPLDGKGDKIKVAIKKLNQNGLQGHKQWLAEVQFLGVVEHQNLVKLIGYCAVDDERGIQRLLVYEFVPNKTLEHHLFNEAYPPLPWNIRLKIALGAAEGLTYLHEGLEFQVIYRDFKTSNILLDGDFIPKLSDFGLAREGPAAGHTHVSTAVMGTYGYAAPEYIETGHLTSKSDVWGFGVVLYEIITGRRSVERNRPRNEQKLLEWVRQYPVESRRFSRIVDPRLENQYSMGAVKEIAKLANSCLLKQAKDRPTMSEVVERLKQAMQLTEMVSPEELIEENSATGLDSEKKDDQVNGNESWRRRMLHLARLSEGVNAAGMRKFMLMKTVGST